MKIIEVKESNINNDDKWKAQDYPESGFYYNVCELEGKQLFFIDKDDNTVTWIMNGLDFIKESIQPLSAINETTNQVSYEFALNILHVALHGNKSDIKDL